jgi:hypothetical protein
VPDIPAALPPEKQATSLDEIGRSDLTLYPDSRGKAINPRSLVSFTQSGLRVSFI